MFLPANYTSGDALAGTITFELSLSKLGINPGVFVYNVTGSSETVTVSFVVSEIPLPAGVFSLLGALGLGALIGRRGRPASA